MEKVDYNIFDLGFNKYLSRGSSALESTIEKIVDDLPLPSILGSGFYEISPTQIGSGEIGGNLTMVAGLFQSANFVSGSAGWQILYDGTVEFNSGVFRGSLVAASIHIPDQDTTANSFHTNSAGDSWWGCTETDFGSSNDNALAYILKTGVAKFQSLTILGGTVNYGKTSLADSTHAGYWISSDGFYFGAVTDASYVKYTISGGAFAVYGVTVDHPTITAIQAGSEIAIQGWQHDLVFSVTDLNTVAWASGTITLLDGTTYSIDAGNTGNMSAINYIYLDIGTSITVLQTTTTASTAVGSGKILVAVAEDGTDEATFQVFGGIGGLNINGSSIAADSITTNELAANSVTATEINVSNLAAIEADLGSITAGNITIDASGYIKGGQTAYDTGSGFWLGYASTAYKFSLGDGTAANSLKWDGTDLWVKGTKLTFQSLFGDGDDGDLVTSSDVTLTADTYYGDLTISNGDTLYTAGYRLFVKGTLTVTGTLDRSGNAGSNGTNGEVGQHGQGGAGGAALTSGSLMGGEDGKTGGSSSGGVGTAGDNAAKALSGNGAAGGAGGSGGDAGVPGSPDAGGAGGAAGSATGTIFNYPRNVTAAYIMYDFLPSGDNIRPSAGSGSGGAGGVGANGNGDGGGGGGSGSTGAILWVAAKIIIVTGTIKANGGAGGDGGDGADYGDPVRGAGGGGGGGAGGNGGTVLLIYNTYTNSGTVEAAAGVAGLGGDGGTSTGGNGANGANASAASAGEVITLEV